MGFSNHLNDLILFVKKEQILKVITIELRSLKKGKKRIMSADEESLNEIADYSKIKHKYLDTVGNNNNSMRRQKVNNTNTNDSQKKLFTTELEQFQHYKNQNCSIVTHTALLVLFELFFKIGGDYQTIEEFLNEFENFEALIIESEIRAAKNQNQENENEDKKKVNWSDFSIKFRQN